MTRRQMYALLNRAHKALYDRNQTRFVHARASYPIEDHKTFRQITIGELQLVSQNLAKTSKNTARVRKARAQGDDHAGISWIITKSGRWIGKCETFGGKTKTVMF